MLPLKKPFIISCIAGGIGGAFYGACNFRKFVMGGMGIFEFPAMMNPNGSMTNMIVAIAGVAITMIIAFVLTILLFKDNKQTEEQVIDRVVESNETTSLSSPANGEVLSLSKVSDDVFATGVLGKGIAIIPAEDMIYAPCAGVITTLFPTGHAVGITTDSGVDVLVHIGIDTVQLNGKGYKVQVQQGDIIQKGTALVEIDRDYIIGQGYSLETPIIVTNSDQYNNIQADVQDGAKVKVGQEILTVS